MILPVASHMDTEEEVVVLESCKDPVNWKKSVKGCRELNHKP